jgi:esterase/lipase
MRRKWLWAIPIILIGVYLCGPDPSTPAYEKTLPMAPGEGQALESFIKANEAQHHLKPDNQARIIWANDSLKQATEYAIVYLHGFSASQAEGEPVHRNIAKEFGCNLYLSRLAEHGIDTMDQMVNLTADEFWESAKQAVAIGKQLGKKVILMGTSTGGSLALKLAAEYPEIHSLVLLSPNVAINDPNAWLLNNPWGLQIARLVLHSNYVVSSDQRPLYKNYWYSKYRIEGAIQLQELLETTMTPATFEKVHQPVLTLYYYRDNIHQDSVVKVSAMKTMMEQLGTPAGLKKYIDIPSAGNHVIGSYIKSQDWQGVQRQIEKFMIDVLKIKPVTRE